jgi:putative tryptophan/tyrosine transport system substrate-binding protein
MHFYRLKRREFITLLGGTVAVWPLAARAQQANRMPRVGVLQSLAESDFEAQSWINALKQGLVALGWTDGLNVRIDVRWAGGETNLIQRFAKELVDLHPDVIVAVGTPSAMAFRQETHTIPIVFISVTDPVAQGLVETLIRPGSNITGFTIFEPEIGSKWMQVLKDIAPETTRAAVIFNPDTAPYYRLYMSSIEAAGASFAVKTFEAPVRSRVEIEAAISELAREPAGAVISMSDTFTVVHRDLIIALAARYRLPAVYPFRFEAIEGGLISYGTDQVDQYRRAAAYVDRILKGEKPADMPVQLPVKFELVINLKTARTLGFAIPNTLLARVDEVIE